MNDLEREVGRLGGEAEALRRDMEAIKNKVDEVLMVLHEARGGWKTLVAIATISGAVGAFVMKVGLWSGWFPK